MKSLKITVFMLIMLISFSANVHAAGDVPGNIQLRLLTANIGNADFMNCGDYFFKLCLNAREKSLRKNIAALDADIILLQEVFDVKWCEQLPKEKNRKKVCYRYSERKIRDQSRRLLGPDYTIVCDSRSHFECIGVRKDFAAVKGCEPGALCRDRGSITHDVPEECDPKAVVFGIDIDIDGYKLRIVDGHPAATGEECRAEEVRRMFEGYGDVPPLAAADYPTIITGDMNLDPYRDLPESPDIVNWHAHVGEGKPFYYLSGIAESDPPLQTCAGRSIDQVITNFATGTCVTLGEASGTVRLDGEKTSKAIIDANDHRAILCDIILPGK